MISYTFSCHSKKASTISIYSFLSSIYSRETIAYLTLGPQFYDYLTLELSITLETCVHPVYMLAGWGGNNHWSLSCLRLERIIEVNKA